MFSSASFSWHFSVKSLKKLLFLYELPFLDASDPKMNVFCLERYPEDPAAELSYADTSFRGNFRVAKALS